MVKVMTQGNSKNETLMAEGFLVHLSSRSPEEQHAFLFADDRLYLSSLRQCLPAQTAVSQDHADVELEFHLPLVPPAGLNL